MDFLQKELDEYVKQVRLSTRLTTSPACLVVDEHDYSPMLERVMQQAKGGGTSKSACWSSTPGIRWFPGCSSGTERTRRIPCCAMPRNWCLGWRCWPKDRSCPTRCASAGPPPKCWGRSSKSPCVSSNSDLHMDFPRTWLGSAAFPPMIMFATLCWFRRHMSWFRQAARGYRPPAGEIRGGLLRPRQS